jgi:hypothetical protein
MCLYSSPLCRPLLPLHPSSPPLPKEMAIVPKRFGIKYGRVGVDPILAMEYGGSSTTLHLLILYFIFTALAAINVSFCLLSLLHHPSHVSPITDGKDGVLQYLEIPFPDLTSNSSARDLYDMVSQKHEDFLSPKVVSETQVLRLLKMLIEKSEVASINQGIETLKIETNSSSNTTTKKASSPIQKEKKNTSPRNRSVNIRQSALPQVSTSISSPLSERTSSPSSSPPGGPETEDGPEQSPSSSTSSLKKKNALAPLPNATARQGLSLAPVRGYSPSSTSGIPSRPPPLSLMPLLNSFHNLGALDVLGELDLSSSGNGLPPLIIPASRFSCPFFDNS